MIASSVFALSVGLGLSILHSLDFLKRHIHNGFSDSIHRSGRLVELIYCSVHRLMHVYTVLYSCSHLAAWKSYLYTAQAHTASSIIEGCDNEVRIRLSESSRANHRL
jgi:hypothetical protein